jgi:hypothetical protein
MQPYHDIEFHRASSSLVWWRDLPANAFTSAHEAALTQELAHIFGADWRASRDDAAVAIARAIRTLHDKSAPADAVDAVMSATLLHVLHGDLAAREILIFGLCRQKSLACALIADGWGSAPVIRTPCASPLPRRRRSRIAQ